MFELGSNKALNEQSVRYLEIIIKKIVAKVCNSDTTSIKPDSSLDEVGSLNRFAGIDIYMAIRGRIGLDIPDLRDGDSISMYAFRDIITFRDLMNYLSLGKYDKYLEKVRSMEN